VTAAEDRVDRGRDVGLLIGCKDPVHVISLHLHAVVESAVLRSLLAAGAAGDRQRDRGQSGPHANPSGQSPNGSRVPGREATASGEAARVPEGNWHSENPSGQSPNGSRVPGREATASGEAARVPEGNWHSENTGLALERLHLSPLHHRAGPA